MENLASAFAPLLEPSLFPWIAAIVGLILGSFYTVCVHRYLAEESIVFPGSKCPHCNHPLHWYENIPLVSWIIQGGRCRHCRAFIGWRYPAMELCSGLWALALALRFGPSWAWLCLMALGGMLLVASFIDFEIYILPDMLTLPGAVLAYPVAAWVLGMGWVEPLLGAGVGAGLFLALQRAYRLLRGVEGLGTGDIKLMLMLGALAGLKGLPMLITLGAGSGVAASILYMLVPGGLGGGRGLQTRIPFGPFLSLGGMLTVLYGDAFMTWYLGY